MPVVALRNCDPAAAFRLPRARSALIRWALSVPILLSVAKCSAPHCKARCNC